MASQAEGLDLSRNSFSSASKEQYPYCYPRAILLPVFVRPGLPAGAEPWLHRPSPPSSVFSMASSSLAPSPQTTITPLRPKRKLSSSTLPPLRLLLSLLLPQTSYTDARASSLSSCLHPLEFGFCPCHCLQSHGHLLIVKPRACSSRSSPQAFSPLCFTQWPPIHCFCKLLPLSWPSPSRTRAFLSLRAASRVHDPLSSRTGGLVSPSGLLNDLTHTLPQPAGHERMTENSLHWYLQLPV